MHQIRVGITAPVEVVISVEGMRPDTEDLFDKWFGNTMPVRDTLEPPVIVMYPSNGMLTLAKTRSLRELVQLKAITTCLYVWPGAKRSDAFAFTVADVCRYMSNRCISVGDIEKAP